MIKCSRKLAYSLIEVAEYFVKMWFRGFSVAWSTPHSTEAFDQLVLLPVVLYNSTNHRKSLVMLF